jgi:hypothetical protein
MKSAARTAATVTVHVPLVFSVRGGRKEIVSDVLASPTVFSLRTGNALLKALARAHRWRSKIESGQYASITELAQAQNVNQSYACRLLRLTLLAPAVVVDILNGDYTSDFMLKQFMKPFPIEWDKQFATFKIKNLHR